MKKQLSFALLTLNIFTLSVLPAKANTTQNTNVQSTKTQSANSVNDESALLIDGSKWCVEVPWMMFVCF